jgi:UDP-N-acetylmuramyl pentapeptide phosphotransferase/UDP-N-acetylglucosamine-1-phosphate transferase
MDIAAAATAGVLVAAAASLLATLAWIVLARRWQLHDEPGQRRLHAQRTPRGGGVGIAVGWSLATLLACAWLAAPTAPVFFLWPVCGAFLVCGLLDDFVALPAMAKLALQVLAAVAVLTPFLPREVSGNWLALGVVWLGLLYFVNAWNFMDGSNGMIAIQSLVLALAVGTWPGQEPGLALAALALAGACLGFLPLNFPRAKVFLGDAGSLLLGSALYLLLLASCREGVMSPLQALLLASVVLADTALTLSRRVLRGKAFWRAHREHLYQYAVRQGHSHARVALAYGAASVLAWLLALSLGGLHSTIVMAVVPFLAWGTAVAIYLLLRRRWLMKNRKTLRGEG